MCYISVDILKGRSFPQNKILFKIQQNLRNRLSKNSLNKDVEIALIILLRAELATAKIVTPNNFLRKDIFAGLRKTRLNNAVFQNTKGFVIMLSLMII